MAGKANANLTPETTGTEERTLRLVLRLQPGENCPLVALDSQVEDIQTQLADGTCHCEFMRRADETVIEHTAKELDEPCACAVFYKYACVTNITDIAGDEATITTYVRDRSVVWNLVDELDEVCRTVELIEITTNYDGQLHEKVGHVTLSELTEKQREAVEAAVESGYYRRPRETSLGDIAEELGISPQALSQRLGNAEEKIMSQLF